MRTRSTNVSCLTLKVRRALGYTVKITLLTFAGNVGFIFTNGDLKATRDKILANRVAAPARAGAVAPGDVYVPAGNTGMEPGKTSFFQALGVPTKIARGTIEITTDLKLVEAGAKVGASEATLLNMLNISPFTYGMKVQQVYEEGQSFSPDVLDIEESQLLKALSSAITTITTICLAANYPTLPSVIHSLINGYKKVISVALEVDYSWEAIDELKDRIANPDKYASAAPAAAAASTEAAAPAAAKEEKEEEKEESDDEGEFSDPSSILLPFADVSQVSVVFSTKCLEHRALSGDARRNVMPETASPIDMRHRSKDMKCTPSQLTLMASDVTRCSMILQLIYLGKHAFFPLAPKWCDDTFLTPRTCSMMNKTTQQHSNFLLTTNTLCRNLRALYDSY